MGYDETTASYIARITQENHDLRNGLLPASTCSATGTFVTFEPLVPAKLTKRWAVMPKDGGHIGMVSWYGPWRKYCFFPMSNTVYEQVCLRELAAFCETQTKLHRAAKSSNRGIRTNSV